MRNKLSKKLNDEIQTRPLPLELPRHGIGAGAFSFCGESQ